MKRLLWLCAVWLPLSGCVLFETPISHEPEPVAKTPPKDPVPVRPGERWYPQAPAEGNKVVIIPLDGVPVGPAEAPKPVARPAEFP